jgi:hypothetical protein
VEWQRQRRSGGATLCACILEPFLVYFLGVLGVLTIPDRELTGIGSTRPDPQSINQQHTLLILGTFVEERQWRGGLIVEHFPQMSSHHNDLFIVPQKRPVQITVHIIYIYIYDSVRTIFLLLCGKNKSGQSERVLDPFF